jgi:hypothetical protein
MTARLTHSTPFTFGDDLTISETHNTNTQLWIRVSRQHVGVSESIGSRRYGGRESGRTGIW